MNHTSNCTINCTTQLFGTSTTILTSRGFNNKNEASRLFQITQTINTFLCTLIVLIGLIGNLLTFCVFKYKQSTKSPRSTSKASIATTSVLRNITTSKSSSPKPSSLTSSQSYILALAFSDLLFLISHTFEDILPNLGHIFKVPSTSVLHLTDRYSVICKITLYIRNASRISSSYLIVFFALERLMVVSKPLKRLKFHYKKFNRNLTIFVFLFSILFTSYTPVISGLRQLENHETGIMVNHICDTLNKYKHVYDYVTIIYVCIQMLIPIIAICYLNFYIVKVLITRKNCVVRRYFKTTKSPTSSSQESAAAAGVAFEHPSSIEIKRKNSDNISTSTTTAYLYPFTPLTPANSIVQISNLNSPTPTPTITNLVVNTTTLQNLNTTAVKCASLKRTRKSKSHSIDLTNSRVTPANSLNNNISSKKPTHNIDLVNLYPNYHEYAQARLSRNNCIPSTLSSASTTASRRRSSLISTSLNTNLELDNSSYFHTHTQDNSCWIFRHSRLLFKLKEAGRATFILILISVSFLILNIPYLIAWLCFFLPLKYNIITTLESKQKRFAFVYITEIFHILNYSVNFFLYCFSSKLFRQELRVFLLCIFKPILCCCNKRFGFNNSKHANIPISRLQQQQQQRQFIRYGSISSASGFLATGSFRSNRRSFSNKSNKNTNLMGNNNNNNNNGDDLKSTKSLRVND